MSSAGIVIFFLGCATTFAQVAVDPSGYGPPPPIPTTTTSTTTTPATTPKTDAGVEGTGGKDPTAPPFSPPTPPPPPENYGGQKSQTKGSPAGQEKTTITPPIGSTTTTSLDDASSTPSPVDSTTTTVPDPTTTVSESSTTVSEEQQKEPTPQSTSAPSGVAGGETTTTVEPEATKSAEDVTGKDTTKAPEDGGYGKTPPGPSATKSKDASASTTTTAEPQETTTTAEETTTTEVPTPSIQPTTPQGYNLVGVKSLQGGGIPKSGVDQHEHCCWWALIGECDLNPFWMRPVCQVSCGTPNCTIRNADSCKVHLNVDKCPWKGLEHLAGDKKKNTLRGKNGKEFKTAKTRGNKNKKRVCKDEVEFCRFWASKKQCRTNPEWMKTNCRKACKLCK